MNRASKRIFDFVFSFLSLFLLVPALLAISMAIWLEDGWPVIFKQRRALVPGMNEFNILKFRTMMKAAHLSLSSMDDREKIAGKQHRDRDRVTRVGRFLRRFRLDELPQLINVLRGEMSLVGPRPLALDDLEKLTAVSGFEDAVATRSGALPGLTGVWQVYRQNDVGYEDLLWMDQYYLDHRSWKLDADLMVRTLAIVLSQRRKALPSDSGKRSQSLVDGVNS